MNQANFDALCEIVSTLSALGMYDALECLANGNEHEFERIIAKAERSPQ